MHDTRQAAQGKDQIRERLGSRGARRQGLASGKRKSNKGFSNARRQSAAVCFCEQLVAGSFDRQEPCARGDLLQGCGHSLGGAEGIARSVDEEGRRVELREVLGAELLGFTRWVQRVGEQKQRVNKARFSRGKHRGLAASVGMASQKNVLRAPAAGVQFADDIDGRAEARLVAGRCAQGRSVRALLAKG